MINNAIPIVCVRNSHLNLFSDDIDNRFELRSLKTNIISTSWCKLFYPFSPLKNYHLCASGKFVKGMTKVKTLYFLRFKYNWNACSSFLWFSQDQIGTPLIRRDPNNKDKLQLLGIATIVRSRALFWPFPMEFNVIAPYKEWIESAW